MKKSTVLEYLKHYKDDEELFIAWWDKDTSGHDLTDEQWIKVTKKLEDNDYILVEVSDAIDEHVYEVLGETNEQEIKSVKD